MEAGFAPEGDEFQGDQILASFPGGRLRLHLVQ
jgi:hypothetical protein